MCITTANLRSGRAEVKIERKGVTANRAVAGAGKACFVGGMWRGVLIGAGGFLGSLARYWLAGRVQGLATIFPTGTFAVNVLGSFVLGLVFTLSVERGVIGPETRLFLAVGFCGGFTTMSTFSLETVALMQQGLFAYAAWSVLTTVVSCLGAVWVGTVLARVL